MVYILFVLSGILGFIFWNLFSGKHEGDKLEQSLRFRIGIYTIHIHHWFIASVVLLVCLYNHITDPIILGLLAGSIIQGLKYRDRFLFIYKTSNFEKIYSKWKK